MTPARSARATAAETGNRAGLEAGAGSGHTRTRPKSPGGPVPRRVSGPAAPRPLPGRSQRTASAPQSLRTRLGAFLASLPDHPLLDRVVRGRAWIPLLGVMLAGIVAMQVELLKLNATTGRSIELTSSLQGRNEILRAQVTSASDPARIERIAGRMGMTMPGPAAVTFLSARSPSVRRAVAGIHVPDVAAFQAALQASTALVPASASTTPTATSTTPASASTTPASASTTPASTSPSTPAGPTTTTTGAPASTAP